MHIARAILYTGTNSFKNKKIKKSGIRKSYWKLGFGENWQEVIPINISCKRRIEF